MRAILATQAGGALPQLPPAPAQPQPQPQPPAPPKPAVRSSPLFTEAYAISLPEDSPERFPRIKGYADTAGIPLQLWKGTKITPEQKDTLPSLGIGTTHYEDRQRRVFNLGVIGAFLAHRALLRHIDETGKGKMGTLIFEDDVVIPPDFYAQLARVESQIPKDWDFIFLDKYKIEGQRISQNIMKLPRDMTAKKNWGIWGFIVRNESVHDKILPKMEHMLDVPDLQINKFAHELNMYLIQPSIVSLDTPTAFNSIVTRLDNQK